MTYVNPELDFKTVDPMSFPHFGCTSRNHAIKIHKIWTVLAHRISTKTQYRTFPTGEIDVYFYHQSEREHIITVHIIEFKSYCP